MVNCFRFHNFVKYLVCRLKLRAADFPRYSARSLRITNNTAKRLYFFAFCQHTYRTRYVLFADSSDKRFSPFHPTENYLPVGCDAAFAEANTADDCESFHTSNSPLFPFCLLMRKKSGHVMAMRKQRIPDELTTRTPSRYYTISYFPRYVVMHFYGTFIIFACTREQRASMHVYVSQC